MLKKMLMAALCLGLTAPAFAKEGDTAKDMKDSAKDTRDDAKDKLGMEGKGQRKAERAKRNAKKKARHARNATEDALKK